MKIFQSLQAAVLAVLFTVSTTSPVCYGELDGIDPSLSLVQKRAGQVPGEPAGLERPVIEQGRPGEVRPDEGRPVKILPKPKYTVWRRQPGQHADCSHVKDTTTSITLLGSMAFIMAIFYLVRSSSVIMAETAWSMVSTMVSIFASVLLHGGVHKLVIMLTIGEGEGEEGEEEEYGTRIPGVGDVFISAVQMFIWWIIVLTVLFTTRTSLLHLKAYGLIGGHILGFAAIDTFGQIASMATFRESHTMTLAVIGMYILVLPLMCYLPQKLMKNMMDYMVFKKVKEQWHEQSTDTAIDFFCMGASYLLSMWMRFFLAGNPPSMAGPTESGDLFHIEVMICVGMTCIILSGVLAWIHHWHGMDQYMDIASTLIAMTASWTLLFAADWTVFDLLGVGMEARSCIALVFSFLAVLFVLASYAAIHYFDFNRRALRGMLTAVSLGVGLSWEKVFDESIEDLEGLGAGAGNIIVSQLILVIVVFPAWMLFMLPHADRKLTELLKDRLEECPLDMYMLWDDDELYIPKNNKQAES